MLIIHKDQLSAMATAIQKRQPLWAATQLRQNHPAWCAQHNTDALLKYCSETLNFARKCGFNEPESLLSILELRVTDQLPWPFSEWQKTVFTRPNFTEQARLAQFRDTLSGADRRIMIRLDTDLSGFIAQP